MEFFRRFPAELDELFFECFFTDQCCPYLATTARGANRLALAAGAELFDPTGGD
jgi:hypothetical protein